MRVDEPAGGPARERHVLLDRNLEPIRPRSPYRRLAHPGQALERGTQLLNACREEVAAAEARHTGLDAAARRLIERAVQLQRAHREERRMREPIECCEA